MSALIRLAIYSAFFVVFTLFFANIPTIDDNVGEFLQFIVPKIRSLDSIIPTVLILTYTTILIALQLGLALWKLVSRFISKVAGAGD